jgi:hypothetical protein
VPESLQLLAWESEADRYVYKIERKDGQVRGGKCDVVRKKGEEWYNSHIAGYAG